MKMDPWSSFDSANVNVDTRKSEDILTEFEDNFSPIISEGLPDSKEYLARLEEKLHKIKTDPNVLRQLAEKREACMQQLLSGVAAFDNDETIDLDTPVENSTILRTIAPQKQALTQGELVELVKYDQLVNEESTSEEDPSKTEKPEDKQEPTPQ